MWSLRNVAFQTPYRRILRWYLMQLLCGDGNNVHKRENPEPVMPVSRVYDTHRINTSHQFLVICNLNTLCINYVLLLTVVGSFLRPVLDVPALGNFKIMLTLCQQGALVAKPFEGFCWYDMHFGLHTLWDLSDLERRVVVKLLPCATAGDVSHAVLLQFRILILRSGGKDDKL